MRLPILCMVVAGCAVDPIPIDSDNCIEHHARTLTAATPADPPLEFKIDRCHLDLDACQDLCDLLMSRNDLTMPSTSCAVAFDVLSVSVHVTYDTLNNGPNCPIAEPGLGMGGDLPPQHRTSNTTHGHLSSPTYGGHL